MEAARKAVNAPIDATIYIIVSAIMMIPIMRAATSRENLIRLGYDVRWYDYPMGHQVCMPEVEEIARFIKEVL